MRGTALRLLQQGASAQLAALNAPQWAPTFLQSWRMGLLGLPQSCSSGLSMERAALTHATVRNASTQAAAAAGVSTSDPASGSSKPEGDATAAANSSSSNKQAAASSSAASGHSSSSGTTTSNSSSSSPAQRQGRGWGRDRKQNRSSTGSSSAAAAAAADEGSQQAAAGSSRRQAELALQQLSHKLHVLQANRDNYGIIHAFEAYLDQHMVDGQLPAEYMPSQQSNLYNLYKTALARRCDSVSPHRMARIQQLDQQSGDSRFQTLLQMHLHVNRREYEQALAVFKQIWGTSMALSGRDVDRGLEAAFQLEDVAFVEQVLQNIRSRRYLISMPQLGALLRRSLRFLAIAAIKRNDLQQLTSTLKQLQEVMYSIGDPLQGSRGQVVQPDYDVFMDFIAAAAHADNHDLARVLLVLVDDTFKEKDTAGKVVPLKFPQGLLLQILNCCARSGTAQAATTAQQVVWPRMLRSLAQPPYHLGTPVDSVDQGGKETPNSRSSSSSDKSTWQPAKPVAAAYHALIETHMKAGQLGLALDAVAELEAAYSSSDQQAASVYGGLRFCIDCIDSEAKVAQLYSTIVQRQDNKQAVTRGMFNLLVRAVARFCSAEDTATVWSTMPAYGLTPDADSYNAVIENLAIVGRPLTMLKVMDAMREQHDKLRQAARASGPSQAAAADSIRCKPNAATYELVLRSLLDAKELLPLREVLLQLPASGLESRVSPRLVRQARHATGMKKHGGSSSSSSSSWWTGDDQSRSDGFESSSSSGGSRRQGSSWHWTPGSDASSNKDSPAARSSRPRSSSSSSSSSAALTSLRDRLQQQAGQGQSSSSSSRVARLGEGSSSSSSSGGTTGGSTGAAAGGAEQQEEGALRLELDSLAAALQASNTGSKEGSSTSQASSLG